MNEQNLDRIIKDLHSDEISKRLDGIRKIPEIDSDSAISFEYPDWPEISPDEENIFLFRSDGTNIFFAASYPISSALFIQEMEKNLGDIEIRSSLLELMKRKKYFSKAGRQYGTYSLVSLSH